jgi:hypothetical protein
MSVQIDCSYLHSSHPNPRSDRFSIESKAPRTNLKPHPDDEYIAIVPQTAHEAIKKCDLR